MPFTSACERRSSTVPARHSSAFFSAASGFDWPVDFKPFAEVHQPLGRVGTAVQQHIFHQNFQLGVDLLIDLQHAGVHDAHVHTGR